MKAKMDVVIANGEPAEPFEYWCLNCKQLRLSLVVTDKCGNCGSTKIVKGDVGKLKRSDFMSWKEKMKEFGGGDLAFLSEDGEVITFVVVGEPILLQGKYKGKVSEKIGCPIVTEDGFVLFIAGKRLARKISKYEDRLHQTGFMAIRHGEQNDITSTYELKPLEDAALTAKLFELATTDFNPAMIAEAVTAAEAVMRQ